MSYFESRRVFLWLPRFVWPRVGSSYPKLRWLRTVMYSNHKFESGRTHEYYTDL